MELSNLTKAKIIGFIVMLFIFYLFGSFISTSFNIVEWDILTRINMVLFGFPAAIFISIAIEEN